MLRIFIDFCKEVVASPYGAVVTHLTCNEKIRGSNPRAGLSKYFWYVDDFW